MKLDAKSPVCGTGWIDFCLLQINYHIPCFEIINFLSLQCTFFSFSFSSRNINFLPASQHVYKLTGYKVFVVEARPSQEWPNVNHLVFLLIYQTIHIGLVVGVKSARRVESSLYTAKVDRLTGTTG